MIRATSDTAPATGAHAAIRLRPLDPAPLRLVLGACARGAFGHVRAALDRSRHVELVGACATEHELVGLIAASAPDVVVLDAGLATHRGGRVLGMLRERTPGTPALALVSELDSEEGLGALLAGARGLIDGDVPESALLAAIERVARGELVLEGRGAEQVLDRIRGQLASQLRQRRRDTQEEHDVERLVAGEGIAIVVQPIMDLATRIPFGYEALSRFELDPPQPPDRVFAAAARLGRGVELELVAIDLALALLPGLPAGTHLAVNASPETVLTADLRARLDGLPSIARIVLEITENAPIADYDAFTAALAPLRARGLKLAIDDTGAGFASMRHILRLAPDIIKLDRSIIELIDRDRQTRALAAALTMFAIESGMSVIAEGIETGSQLAVLQTLGVNAGQGYLLGRPAPPRAPGGAGPEAS